MLNLLPLLALMIFLLVGLPIAFSLAGAGILGIWLITGDFNTVLGVVGTTTFTTAASFVLTTVPMFILMAYFSSSSGLAEEIYNAGAKWLSSLRGGLAVATVFACGVFGAMSGSSTAAATVMAKIAMPNMRRFGYSETLAGSTVAVGATLDVLIPPSVAMVIYGMMTGQPIDKLLIATVIPGIVVGIFLAVIIVLWVTVRPSDAPDTEGVPWPERWKSLLRIWPSLLLILVVIGFLYAGIATPTEVGAVGAFMAAFIGVCMGRLTWSSALDALKGTVRTTAMIFIILVGGMIFGHFMTLSQVPQHMIEAITHMNVNRWVVMVGIITAYFLISMFMDELPLLIITVQVTFPLVVALKFDPIWYGVVNMMMGCMGLVFPPVGLAAMIVSATANVDLTKVYTGCCVLIIALVLTTALLLIFPGMALWLPSMMR